MSKARLGVVLADEQFLENIPLGPIYKYIADNASRIDYLIELGDMLDLTALQGWTNKSPADVDWDWIRREIAAGNAHLDATDKYLGGHVERRYSLGNHEERLLYFRQKHKDHSYWRKNKTTIPYLVRDMKLRERGYKFYSQNQVHRIGKLHFFHGDDWGVNHCRNNVRNYSVNLMYGHVHVPERFTKLTPIASHPVSAWSLGCLCTTNPRWKKGAPNKWVNGFAIVYFLPNGNFQVYPIDIIKGQFIAPDGKIYS